MNIFVLDNCAIESARMMCDKHVVKMIVESCQLLSTAHHVLDGKEIVVDSGKRKYKTFVSNNDICKATMINHPCTIWTRESKSNYIWLWNHAYALCKEYTLRYGKIHSMQKMLEGPLRNCPNNINNATRTTFVQAMPDQYKNENAVIAYRQYYLGEKVRFAKWKIGNIPIWFATQNPNSDSLKVIII
jgi:hypothetical protein